MGSAKRRSFFDGFVLGCTCLSLLLVTVTLLSKGLDFARNGLETDTGMDELSVPAEQRTYVHWSYSLPFAAIAPRPQAEEENEGGEGDVEYIAESPEEATALDNATAEEESGPGGIEDASVDIAHPASKKTLLTVVVSSVSHMENIARKVRSTWGSEGSSDYQILVGNSGVPLNNIPDGVLELNHSDFPSFIYLTREELAFVLSQVREAFLDSYKWFLIVPSNTYVSIHHMKKFLLGLHPYEVVYMGHPSSATLKGGEHYCEAGPGILLSNAALIMMDGLMEKCLREGEGRTSDAVLGGCVVNHLHTDCHKHNTSLEDLFMYDKEVKSRETATLWTNKFEAMMTLYPIRDYHQLDAVHAWNQAREISRHQKLVSEVLAKLKGNSMCSNSTQECSVPDGALSEMTYNEFSRNCHLFWRGFVPELRRKVVNWDIAIGNTLYNDKNFEPRDLVYGAMSEQLHYVTSVAMEILREKVPDAELRNIANIYIRYKGTVGQEFILDLELIRTGKRGNDSSFEKRVALLLPHQPQMTFLDSSGPIGDTTKTRINIITPLDGLNRRKVSRFQRFYYGLCVKKKRNCRLVYIFYTDSKKNIQFMKDYLNRYSRKYTLFKYEFVTGTGSFNKTKAYNLGMSVLKDDELALLADLDLGISDSFLNRCRLNTIRGRRMYYPDIFKYYDMYYVYRGRWRPKHYDYIRQHGHWSKYSTICLYKSDYTTIGGIEEISRWEIESEKLRFPVNGSLEVIQAPDGGVSHWYEEMKCDTNMPPAQFSNCLTRRKDDLADRSNLANYVLSLENKCRAKKGLPKSKLL